MMRSHRGLLLLALGAALSGAACDEKKPSLQSAAADAAPAPDKYATADPKLAKALQATTSTSAASGNGPPPAGVFPSGGAETRHPRGTPTKVDLVSDGSEPRLTMLAPDGSSDSSRSWYGPATLELEMQMGPRVALPTIDLAFALSPAKKDDGGADWLVADVRKAIPARQQLGQLPAGADKEIGFLEGTSLRIKMTSDGRESDMQVRLSKKAPPDLERIALSAAEALVFASVPIPPKPVGVGAMWIAETRMPLSGLEVIAYRAYRVKEIDGDRLHLALDVKAYAVDKEPQLQGVPKGATLEQFDSQSGGELELVRGESLARKATLQQRLVMVFQAPGAPAAQPSTGQPQGNMLTAQMQSKATMVRGDDLHVTARQP